MKHRKKQSTIQNKQEEQHQRNLFYKKMQHTIAILGDASAFDLLDKKMLEFLYYSRIRPYRIIAQGDNQLKIKPKLINTINTTLNQQLHKTLIDIGQQKTRVSLYDFGVYIETLYLFWRNADLHKPEFASRFRACFPVFNDDFKETRVQALISVDQKLEVISWLYSDITSKIIRFVPERFDKTSSVYGNSAYYNNYLIEVKDAESETLEIDGHIRTIYKVYTTKSEGFIPMTITPEKLGMDGLMQKFPLKVFIQMHAFERIEIRLGKFFRMFHYPYIIANIIKSEPIPAGNKNSFLIPVTNLTARLGYLKADVIGDKLVIRTFLFLTNNGTPEGKKLNHLAGLQKADKSYLGIDKLSTFILSDIKKDEKLKALFYEAGCGELFKLDKTLLNEPGDRELATSKFMSHYLGI
jgi:hypothetical protein